jgi:hypothetical protein
MATKLAMTVAVKAMDTQRWVCRINVLQFNGTYPTAGLRKPLADEPGYPVPQIQRPIVLLDTRGLRSERVERGDGQRATSALPQAGSRR